MDGDCGGLNPLKRLAVHSGSTSVAAGRHHVPADARPSRDDQYINEFMAEQQRRQVVPASLSMSGLLQEMRQIDEMSSYSSVTPQRAPPVAMLASQANWAEEFLVNERKSAQNVLGPHVTRLEPHLPSAHTHHMQHRNRILPASHWESVHTPAHLQQWSGTYTEDNDLVKTARDFSESVTDPDMKDTKFMQFVKDIADEQVVIHNDEVVQKPVNDPKVADWVNQYRSADERQSGGGKKSLVEKWAEEMSAPSKSETKSQGKESDFWDTLEKQWEDLAREEMHPWLDAEQSEPYKVYKFAEDNPLINHPDPFAEGLKRLTRGDIPNAVLLFEVAVQKNAEHAEAWQYLGTSQAENEQEPYAIAALNRCLELEADNLTALLALAVSYTNESMQVHACNALLEWLRQNPKYKSLVAKNDNFSDNSQTSTSYMTEELHDRVKSGLLLAVQSAPSQEIDPDVQCCLGVLFNLSGDYERAVDCFKTALHVNPNDSLLWNRLGATLANSSRSEEAVDAYRHALGLSPGFIRSRYNLGIACINLGAHSEAIEHFLQALNMQKKGEEAQMSGQSVMSDNIWSTLRMTLSLIGRTDMYKACELRQLDVLNRAFGVSEHPS